MNKQTVTNYYNNAPLTHLQTSLIELQDDLANGCLRESLADEIEIVKTAIHGRETSTMRFQVEFTDTFAGEANYCWCRRATIEAPNNITDLALVRRAKSAIGLSGVRCRRSDLGDTIALYPHNSATVLFITPVY